MKAAIEKVQHVSGCFGRLSPQVPGTYASPAPPSAGRLLRFGAAALIAGAVLMLCASTAALYLWKVGQKNVYNIRYSTNINGEAKEGSVEIDSDNNPGRFKTGSGAGEAVEIHDFQIGISGIRFFRGDKCYIKKSQTEVEGLPQAGNRDKDSLMFDLTDEITPARLDEDSPVWVAADEPLKDTSLLGNRILSLCGELPIYWLQPAHPKDGARRSGEARRAKRQLREEESERRRRISAARSRDGGSRARGAAAAAAAGAAAEEEKEEEEGAESTGSAYNPENPYQRGRSQEGDAGAMIFDPMLDHRGICCSECRRSYTHCQRICEPLLGYWPWPYDYRGCRVACRVIMPCRWWVARILGVV